MYGPEKPVQGHANWLVTSRLETNGDQRLFNPVQDLVATPGSGRLIRRLVSGVSKWQAWLSWYNPDSTAHPSVKMGSHDLLKGAYRLYSLRWVVDSGEA